MSIDISKAKQIAKTHLRGASIEACVPYKGDFLLRIKHPLEDEADYDPFFLVTSDGILQEFSIMTDGDPSEVAEAFKKGVQSQ